MKKQDFELFKSNVCHAVKTLGELKFIETYIAENRVEKYYEEYNFLCAFYMLAMLDYLSKKNNISPFAPYDYLRELKLHEPVYPLSAEILIMSMPNKKEEIEKYYIENAIAEFLRHNIVEGDIESVM